MAFIIDIYIYYKHSLESDRDKYTFGYFTLMCYMSSKDLGRGQAVHRCHLLC